MVKRRLLFTMMFLCTATASTSADVITDWNETAGTLLRMPPPQAHRATAMVHVAMFDAINSIEQRYRPFLAQLSAAPGTSKDAAAATAAGIVLAGLLPHSAEKVNGILSSYLAAIPNGEAKSNGIKLGETIAAKVLEARAKDGADVPDDYRPKTKPGVYVPTAAVVAPMWGKVRPFTMTSPAQFRPGPPPALSSKQWASDLNEIKVYGSRSSAERSASQTENARFWLATGPQAYDPAVRQIVAGKNMSLIESARFMALTSAAMADALIAVLEAKYHYELWRPVTAIRNGDLHNNAAVKRDASWQPLDSTPMHPEYPCAHCIVATSLAGVVEGVLGSSDVPEFSMTSPTAPGVTHKWTNMRAFADEISEARIWAGFHYRFSTRVGQEMGYMIGHQAAQTIMQPANQRASADR
jgi:PAP2 superfamily